MKRALLLVSPTLIVDLFKAGPARAFDVTDFALPEDARFVDVRYINSERAIALEVESETFNDLPPKAKQPPILPSPVCRVVTDEELLERVARSVVNDGLAAAEQKSEVPGAPDTSEVNS